jgi:hypothetical protein
LTNRFSDSPLPVGGAAPDVKAGDDDDCVLGDEIEQRVREFAEERAAHLLVRRLKGGRVTSDAREARVRRAEEFKAQPSLRPSYQSNAS